MSGPMPTQFRWLWYLVGLAGMALAVVGLLAMIGSIVNDGLILPVLGLAAVGLGLVLVRYRRRPRQDAGAGVAATPADGTSMEPPADPTAAPAALAHPVTAAVKTPGRTSRR